MLREHASRDSSTPGPAAGRGALGLYQRLTAELRQAAALAPTTGAATHAAAFEGATSTVVELQSELARQPATELAPRLAALYSYFSAEIAAMARTPDPDRLERLIAMVEGLRRAPTTPHASATPDAHGIPNPPPADGASVLRRVPDTA